MSERARERGSYIAACQINVGEIPEVMEVVDVITLVNSKNTGRVLKSQDYTGESQIRTCNCRFATPIRRTSAM